MLIAPDDEGCQSFVVVVTHGRPVVGVWLHGARCMVPGARADERAPLTGEVSWQRGSLEYVRVGVCPCVIPLGFPVSPGRGLW
jgi:hypothetical protein